MGSFSLDIRYSLRSLSATPTQTLTLLLLLVVGSGACVGMFTIVNSALFGPLPYPNPEDLVIISEAHPRRGSGASLRPANFLDLRTQNEVFAQTTAAWGEQAELTAEGGTQLVRVQLVLEDYFEALAVKPLHGRTFAESDFTATYEGLFDWRTGNGSVAVLNHVFWQQHFGGRPDALGADLEINGLRFTIVGVMPPTFQGLGGAPVAWIPWVLLPEERDNRATHVFFGIARLAKGVNLVHARAEVKRIYQNLELQYPAANAGWTANLNPLREVILGDAKLGILLLQGGAAIILLIACFNVASILIARASDREHEILIKQALGAAPIQIARQVLLECFILSAAGAALSLLGVWACIKFLATFLLETVLPFRIVPTVDMSVVIVSVILSVALGLFVGIGPFLYTSRCDPRATLISRKNSGVRGFIVGCQAALAMALLCSGGLIVKSLVHLQRADLGFVPSQLLTMTLHLPRTYDTAEAKRDVQERLLEAIRATPAVEGATVALYSPLTKVTMNLRFEIQGRASESTDSFSADAVVVGDSYFRTIGATLVRGRYLLDADSIETRRAVVIDETLAREYWPTEDPLGTLLRFPYPDLDREPFTIVGIVRDIVHERLAIESNRTLYLSQEQSDAYFDELSLLVRTSGDPAGLVPTLRLQIANTDSAIVVQEALPMLEVSQATLQQPRVRATLLSVYASIALLMAAAGVYGLLAYSVVRRTREIGIRIALGAAPADITKLIMTRAVIQVGGGVAAGGSIAYLAMGSATKLLYGVSAADPVPYLLSGGFLLVAAGLGSCWPLSRAVRLDAFEAIRSE